ncbi:MAG TPA: glycosyltransferase, partial [Polyangia bacterium]|nr:glycosyltransferase [Polyangia bacterium]
STDDTRERLARFEGRICYLHQDNRGLPAARNRGLREASGEWVAFLDADDLWHPDKTRLQLETAHALKNVDFLGTPGRSEPMPERLPERPPVRMLEVRDFLCATPVCASGVLVRRRCFEQVGGFDESLRSVEDRDMWLRLAVRFASAQMDAHCVYYREHPAQMNRRAERMYRSYEAVLAKFFREQPEHANLKSIAYAFMYMDASIAYMNEGARREAIRLILRSLRAWPWSARHSAKLSAARRWKLLVRSLLGESLFHSLNRRLKAE